MHREFASLLEGNATHAARFASRFDDVQDVQVPGVVTVCCSDSRVLQDHMWGNDEPGRIFTCSNIGNRVVQRTAVGRAVSGDVLYPITHTETRTAVVVGHTGCGAVTAAYDGLTGDLPEETGIEHCVGLLQDDLEAGVKALPDGLDRTETINYLVEHNVDGQAAHLLASDDVPDAIDVVGVVYDFQDAYSEQRGLIHVVNVNGETDVSTLRESHPEIEDRIRRLWER